jgi:hypothetical protein
MFKGRKWFSELNAGDYVYWVYKRRNYLVNVLVEKYRILEIKHKNNGELELKLTHDFYITVNPNDMISSREDSFFAIDEEGIEWAVDKIKMEAMNEYQKRITAITEEMCNIMKAPYKMYDKT